MFISYSAASAPLAEKLSDALETRGFSPLSDTNIPSGAEWKKTVEDRLRQSDAVVFLLAPEEKVSPWVQYEWRTALKYSWPDPPTPPKPLIPLLIGRAEAPSFLQDRIALRFEDRPEEWESIINRLAALLKSPTGAKDESGYEAAKLQQQKGLRDLEEWAKAVKASEEGRNLTDNHTAGHE